MLFITSREIGADSGVRVDTISIRVDVIIILYLLFVDMNIFLVFSHKIIY